MQIKILYLVEEEEELRELWVQETLALLEPLARRSPAVCKMLAAEISIFCQLLYKPDGPLSMSLGERLIPLYDLLMCAYESTSNLLHA